MEEDAEFVYLALERCKHSLADLLSLGPPTQPLFLDSQAHPTPCCMQVLPLPACPPVRLCLSVYLPAGFAV